MQLAYLLEELKEQELAMRAKKGRAAGGDATPEQKANRLRDDVSRKRSGGSPKPKKHNRSETAKKANVGDHKARQAIFVKDKAPELAAKINEGELSLAEACRTESLTGMA